MNRRLPHVALSRHPHDRHGLYRTDASWLDTKWAEPETKVLVVAGTRVRLTDGKVEWVSAKDAPDGVRVLLGERNGSTWFALIADGSMAKDDPEWVSLRAALLGLADGDGPLVLHAMGLAEWHWATKFCPRCGGTLSAKQAGHVLACAACGKEQFPRTDPAVIMIVADGEPGSVEERCLLGRGSTWPEGRFSTLAGFVEPGETMEDAVRREVHEETGVQVGEVDYFASQPWPLPASLMIGFTGRAISTEISIDEAEIADARWFTRQEMREQAEAGTLILPGGVSISRSLIETWYGGDLPGQW